MQRAAALDQVHQDRRHMLGGRGQEHGAAGNPRAKPAIQERPRRFHRGEPGEIAFHERRPAPTPDQHAGDQACTDQHRHIAAVKKLEHVGDEKRNVEEEKEAKNRACLEPAPAPGVPRDDVVEDRGDRHCAGHRNAVRRRQLDRLSECQYEHDAPNRQHVIDFRDIDLALGVVGGVLDGYAGQIAQEHRLAGKRECTRYQGLRGDDGSGTR